MKEFLAKKNIVFTVDRYFIKALSSMASGLFASLLIGQILKVIGQQFQIGFLVTFGTQAMDMMGPAIGVAVAYGLQAPPLVLFASVITGMAGAEAGGPAGAFVAAVIGAEFGKLVSKETKIDIIITPAVTILMGSAIAALVGPAINAFMLWLGEIIMWATAQQPFLMGILLAVIVGIVLTLPISSAALMIMLQLGGLAAGAATVGCCAQMVGFAVISFKENGWGGIFSQGLGTSMLQMPNIIRNPRIWLPPTLAAAVLGPMATSSFFSMVNSPAGAGMGTCGLVGQITTLEAMGFTPIVFGKILILHFVLPALLSLLFAALLRQWHWIKDGDMKLDV